MDLTLSTGCPPPKITLLDQPVIITRSKGEKKGLKIRRIDWPNYRGRSLLRFDFPLTLDLGSRYIAVILLSRCSNEAPSIFARARYESIHPFRGRELDFQDYRVVRQEME